MYKKNTQSWIKHIDFILLDIICLQIAFTIAAMIRHGLFNPYADQTYRNLAIAITAIDALIIVFFESFKNVLKRGYYREFMQTIRHDCLVLTGILIYLFSTQRTAVYSRLIIGLMGLIYLIISYGMRLMWKCYLLKRMEMGGERSLLIITVDSMVDTVVSNIKNNNYEMFRLTGIAVLNKDMEGQIMDGVPVVANADTISEYVCREWVDEVFIDIPENEESPDELVAQFMEMGVTVHRKLFSNKDHEDYQQMVERIGNYTVLTTSINSASVKQLFAKRCLDILGGLVGCLITGILIIVLAPAIYIQSPGPIFFTQTRVGRNGRKFKIYKFRSMYMDAEERKAELMEQNTMSDGMMFKMEFDTRVIGNRILKNGKKKTGVGNFIRSFSLDEFPQFLNVLKGDMSLVGTRPPTVDEWDKYELHHRARLAIKPGLTGMWQVSGRSNITDFEQVVELDKKYIAEWTPGLDIKILCKTVLVVLGKDGAK